MVPEEVYGMKKIKDEKRERGTEGWNEEAMVVIDRESVS